MKIRFLKTCITITLINLLSLTTLARTSDRKASTLPLCSQKKIFEILEPARNSCDFVVIDCTAIVPASSTITKQVHFAGATSSGASLDCGGGNIKWTPGVCTDQSGHSKPEDNVKIKIYSKELAGSIVPLSNVTIRNCNIEGGIIVKTGASDKWVRDSSRLDRHHRARMQAMAPSNINLDSIKITALGTTNLYVGSGTTYLTLRNSRLDGDAGGPSVYLDSESAYNTIYQTSFATRAIAGNSGIRENIAIDGSAYNNIIKNKFYNLKSGGIKIYRNCGETGIVRVQGPMYNHILNNVFSYADVNSPESLPPAIWIGSRQGVTAKGDPIRYCDDDKGLDYGSSISNLDFAKNNVVAQNRFYGRKLETAIKNSDTNNIVESNTSLAATQPIETDTATRCFIDAEKRFISEGTLYSRDLKQNGSQTEVFRCSNGVLEKEQ